jgi:hypothetical protein
MARVQSCAFTESIFVWRGATGVRGKSATVLSERVLAKIREMPAEIILSGHGEPIVDHVSLIDIAQRRRRRSTS